MQQQRFHNRGFGQLEKPITIPVRPRLSPVSTVSSFSLFLVDPNQKRDGESASALESAFENERATKITPRNRCIDLRSSAPSRPSSPSQSGARQCEIGDETSTPTWRPNLTFEPSSEGYTTAANESQPASCGSSIHRVSSTDSASSATSITTTSSHSKRFFEDEEDKGTSENGKREKRPRKILDSNDNDDNFYACPFAKHDPVRYSARNLHEASYRGCSTCFLRDIPRLKQHLLRKHSRPEFHCSCCFRIYDEWPLLQEHVRLRQCSIGLCPWPEKMTPEQLNAIKRRQLRLDSQAKWYNIYRILFPGSKDPDTPFTDFSLIEAADSFVDFLYAEAPGRIAHSILSLRTSSQLVASDNNFVIGSIQILETVVASTLQVLRHEYLGKQDVHGTAGPFEVATHEDILADLTAARQDQVSAIDELSTRQPRPSAVRTYTEETFESGVTVTPFNLSQLTFSRPVSEYDAEQTLSEMIHGQQTRGINLINQAGPIQFASRASQPVLGAVSDALGSHYQPATPIQYHYLATTAQDNFSDPTTHAQSIEHWMSETVNEINRDSWTDELC